MNTRTSWQVTRSVWHAMFIREALARTMADRMAWFWMLFEPIAMITIMVLIRTTIMGRMRHIDGAEYIPWIITGLFGFFLVRENLMRPIGAVDANAALFAYRQVKPIDPVFIRCYLEGMLRTFIFLLFILAGVLLEINFIPDEPLHALFYWLSLWLLGTSAGLIASAIAGLVPEIGKIIRLASLPLLIISGVIFPLNFIPHTVLEYLMWNPIVHGLELLRGAFFDSYRPVTGTSAVYLWCWILSFTALGLALHLRFEQRLKRQ
ncbi:transport permease protein [Marinobacterium nitratireducens]|uniref:Transport permease protein n=1 Tax=Marinobacterium nitratireducens TaxID=518897 RepID=A0A917ZAD8_9GAMM|nr:ABC transporter permease [Marinobacterium nitratireducens]GGO79576.1 transport permease protein [Marinobacterium nitratireducens]